jgi:hypothetical protein
MTGDIGPFPVYPVANPSLREGRRLRITWMAIQQSAGRVGPVRQKRYRDDVVSPLALEMSCRELLCRAQASIVTIVGAQVYAASLSGTVRVADLRRHEWEIAVALREISELLVELAASFAAGGAGPMTLTVAASQNRAILIARDGIAGRVAALERLAGQVAAAEAARQDWETAHQLAARNDKYLDLVARTAADERASAEISSFADQATEAARLMRETLAEAALAAEALALPDRT